MHWLCRFVGHKPPVYAKKGWFSPGEEYGKLRGGGIDGTGRVHWSVMAECARCTTLFRVVRVHTNGKQ